MKEKYLTISVVTPTYNSEKFLEASARSILEQKYPALEYIVIDGASTDGTLDIIQRYEDRISFWLSEPDSGMYDGIQKGFRQTDGEIMAWLNSDDMYLPWTLHMVNDIFSTFPEVDWITSIRPLLWNEQGFATDCMALPGFSKQGFWRGEHMPGSRGFMIEAIQQESTFWRRSLWERVGSKLDTSLQLAGDFELWVRFYQQSDLVGVRTPLSGFRVHSAQLTASKLDQYYVEARAVLERSHGLEQSKLRSFLRRNSALIPGRFRSKLARLGLFHRSQTIVYDQLRSCWKIRRDFI
ncbi:MAG: glycosyltransferase [Anaerolineae bacterium]|nr:glycosyltransferase [Anaerolineae bacterium]